jgi:hypothetical protein
MANLVGDSKNPATPAVTGSCPGGDGVSGTGRRGVVGTSHEYQGVFGHSDLNAGVVGESPGMHAVFGITHGAQSAGVYGTNDVPGNTGSGVFGENPGGDGVVGAGRRGVVGISPDFQGVYGHSDTNAGVVGESQRMDGLYGISHNPDAAGVSGHNDGGNGIIGFGRRGVVGLSPDFQGVYGHSDTNAGVVGESQSFDGVWGQSHNLQAAGVSGHNPGGLAGYFDGNVVVTGDLLLAGADYAESFASNEPARIAPGSVVVLDDDGGVELCEQAYDGRVAGVVSGAGTFRPGVVLDSGRDPARSVPLALMGKVFCRVDGSTDPIRVGDLLTSSPVPGHAMRASDRYRAIGAVVGKALAPCDGLGEIPILVALQ